MTYLKIFNYNDNSIEFEVINGQVFANATVMCQAFGKRPNDFLNLASTKRYLEAITKKTGSENLVEIRNGGANPGTWIHERLILKLASWLDVNFEIWCDTKIAELLRTGKVELNQSNDTNLTQHLDVTIQKGFSKKINALNFSHGGVTETIDYNRKNCLLHTKKRPNEVIQIGKDFGLKSKQCTSAKEVIRNLKPELACTMSFTDSLVFGHGIAHEVAAETSLDLVRPLFKKLIELGVNPKTLGNG
jgi:hypothetical protein